MAARGEWRFQKGAIAMTVKIQGPLFVYVRSERHGQPDKTRYHLVGQAWVLLEGGLRLRLDFPVAVTEFYIVPDGWNFDEA
jgi:hypothetical protein